MKKITTLLMILGVTLSYSQTFPIDFSDPLDAMNCFDCSFQIVQDAGNDVGSVTGGGLPFDTAQLPLAQNLDLSDDTNNTITFRVKPMAEYGTRTHLLKFEAGTGPNTELTFTTTGTDWQDITLNYPAGLGSYSLMVLFTDFNNNEMGTYLFDDFAGGTNVEPIPDLEIPSPTPSTPDSEVLSIYCDTGGFTTIWTPDYAFGEVTIVDTDAGSGVNEALKVDFSIAGYGQGTNSGVVTDVNAYNWFHFDYWADSNATQIRMILIEEDGSVNEFFYELSSTGEEPITFETWTSVDIPLSFFTNLGFSKDKFFQYKLGTESDLVSDVVYFDNLYFSVNEGTSLGFNEFETVDFKVYPNPTNTQWTVKSSNAITKIEVFDVLGKQVMVLEPNALIGTIDASVLTKGLYLASINSNGSKQIIKLIKN